MPLSRSCPKASSFSALRRLLAARQLCAFGDHNDRELLPVIVTVLDDLADVVDIQRLLRHADRIRAAGNAAGDGDPARVAPHHLADDDAVVRFGGGVQAVDGLGRDADCGVEAEAGVGAAQIVVDGLRNADNLHALFDQRIRHALRVVAADGDERVEIVGLDGGEALVDAAFHLARIGARGAQDGAAEVQDAGDRIGVQRPGLVLHHAAPAFEEADELILIVENSFAYHGADHRIQSRAVTAACQYSNSHVLPVLLSKRLSQSNRMIRAGERRIKRARLSRGTTESRLDKSSSAYLYI